MKLERVRLEKLLLHPANPRLHNQRNIDAIKASLVQYGQQTPIVIDGKNIVLKGNGTVVAARELKWKEILAQRTILKGVQAVGYLISDNRCSDLSEFDDPALTKLLESVKVSNKLDIAALGYDEAELNELIESVAKEFKQDAETPPRLDRLAKIKCPKCGHMFERYE